MTSALSLDGEGPALKWLALVIVAALHVSFYQWLSQEGFSHAGPRPTTSRMWFEFIQADPRPQAIAPVEPEGRVTAAESLPETPRESIVGVAGPVAGPEDPWAAAPDAPLVIEWTDPARDQADFRMNLPDGRPTESLAVDEPPGLRLRRKVTGKDVVEGAAQLLGFWPEGYESDPCPRIKRNIGGLMTDTRAEGRARLAEELRRQQSSCGR